MVVTIVALYALPMHRGTAYGAAPASMPKPEVPAVLKPTLVTMHLSGTLQPHTAQSSKRASSHVVQIGLGATVAVAASRLEGGTFFDREHPLLLAFQESVRALLLQSIHATARAWNSCPARTVHSPATPACAPCHEQ
jgi:hypothetical protein